MSPDIPHLVIMNTKNDQGYYPVLFQGEEYALTSYPHLEFDYYDPYCRDQPRRPRVSVSFQMVKAPPPPPTKRRRSIARSLGLRRPV